MTQAIALTGTVSKAWLAEQLDVRFSRDYYFDPEERHRTDSRCNAHVAATFPDLDLFYSESNLGQKSHWRDDMVLIGGIQPNMLLGMLLGAEFKPEDCRDADISPDCLAGRKVDELPAPGSLVDHTLVALWRRQIADVRRLKLCPVPPFFWDASGRAAVHGPMTTAIKFFGTDFFGEMLESPETCDRVIAWLCDCYIVLCRHFAEVAGLKISSLHIGECSGCMVNADTHRRFAIAPSDRMAEKLARVRFHSCGDSNHLFPSIRSARQLAALDLGGASRLDAPRRDFGPDFPLEIAPLVADLRAPTERPILAWLERRLAENAGGPLIIKYHLEPGYRIENIRALARRLAAVDRDMTRDD